MDEREASEKTVGAPSPEDGHMEEVGTAVADPSPAAVIAEAERLRIRLESEIIREDWRERGNGE